MAKHDPARPDLVELEQGKLNLDIRDPAKIDPAAVGIWLFVAADLMFFVGLLGSYVLLRAASPDLFSRMASVLSKPLGAVGAASLVAGSIAITMAVKAGGARSRTARFVLAALLCGVGFLVAVWLQFSVLLRHHTLIARESSSPEAAIWVYDGVLISESPTDISLDGLRAPWPPDAADASVASTNAVAPIELDIHSICPADVAGAASGPPAVYMIPADAVIDRSNYGPWKNLFFACYFTLNAAVAAHLIVAMFVTAAMLLKSIYSPAPFKRLPVLAVFWRFITCAGVVVAVLMVLS